MTSVLCVALALAAVLFTQLRADKMASARESLHAAPRLAGHLSDDMRLLADNRGQAYVTFLAAFQRHYDELHHQDVEPSRALTAQWLDDMYDALAQVRVYGTARAAEDAETLLEWLAAARTGRHIPAESGTASAFVEHAQQDLRLLAS